MILIETFYLIDYENVNSAGLAGCDRLTKSDSIMIFFTKNAMKINMSDIANHGNAELNMIEVPSGKQSVDIHIGSYLGYLAGVHSGKDCSIIIISKDSDFDNVIKYWNNKTGLKVSRAEKITPDKPKAVKVKQKPSPEKIDSNKNAANRTKVNNEIIQILSKGGFENEVVGLVASTVVKNIGEKDRKQKIYRTIISNFGQKQGLNIYNHIKKHI